jgi:hypothetical protein
MSNLMDDVISGSRIMLSRSEKVEIELEMLDWEYNIKEKSVESQTMINDAAKTMLKYWLRVYKIEDECRIKKGFFKIFC